MSRAGAEKDPLRKNWQQQATRMCQSECYMMFASIYIALNSSALLFRLAFFHGHIHTATNEIVYISVCSYPCTQKANMWFHFGLKNSIPNDMCNEPSIGFFASFHFDYEMSTAFVSLHLCELLLWIWHVITFEGRYSLCALCGWAAKSCHIFSKCACTVIHIPYADIFGWNVELNFWPMPLYFSSIAFHVNPLISCIVCACELFWCSFATTVDHYYYALLLWIWLTNT